MFMKQVGAERVWLVRAETELTFESNGRTSAPSFARIRLLLHGLEGWRRRARQVHANVGHETRGGHLDALKRSPTQRDEAPVESQEDGRRDGAKRLPEDHSELKRAATRLAREETAIEVPQESNEYVSQSRGFVEEAVQAVERKVHIEVLSGRATWRDCVSQPSSSCLPKQTTRRSLCSAG